ncbi:MAG TPA: mycothione reductase [Candidatus Corynebacterium gallistercoris]|uniref:Mycothione reductase n=1 Tax=Candidatus Corynebacterium gallistercoris TaxID=2838530 RepID=A0A9D1RYR8_9CORY|nr:mycothione reductase [Candidatus Corynebacterium gallistercoris]
MTSEHFDLIVVGTGSGNSIPNHTNHDKKIAIIEKGIFGGTCINVGCIPTKMYVYAADVAREMAELDRLSLTGEFTGVKWEHLQQRIFGDRIDPISESGRDYRAGDRTPNVTLFEGTASFTEPKTLQVAGTDGSTTTITGDQIVLATGSRPFIPDVIADSGIYYHTNETIMRLDSQPESLVVLGGGIVAVEFAHVFSSLGTKVTVVNRSPHVLKNLDETVVERFNAQAEAQWDTRLGLEVTGARKAENGLNVIELDDGSTVEAEQVLVAMGRTNNSDLLNTGAGGVDTDDKGRILVDEYGRTSAEGVWALGDASNEFLLKHVANAEQRVISHNLAHPDDLITLNHEHVPGGIFTHPQIGTVGMTEQEARESGRSITVKVQEYSDVAYGWAMEDSTGFCKLIADAETGELLGAHIMGPQATTILQLAVTQMNFGIDCRLMARNQYWPHPALTELYENALLGLEFVSAPPEGLLP